MRPVLTSVEDTLCWRWELTPAELLSRFKISDSEDLPVRIETKPFTCKKLPLEGTPYFYQLAVSRRSLDKNMISVRRGQPELPESGDRRSGILVFCEDKIIASCVIAGLQPNEGYRLVRLAQHVGQGLVKKMLTEWLWQTKTSRVAVLPIQTITRKSAKALLVGHKALVLRAIKEGLPVPAAVINATLGELDV